MLPLRPNRNEGEGLPQYLARLAATNGYGSLSSLLREKGLGEFGVMSGTMPEWSAILPGRSDAAARSGGQVDGRWVTVSGQRIRRKQWSVRTTPQICPCCWNVDLEERDDRPGLVRNWQRTVWDIRPVTICEKHGVELVDHCGCGRPFSREDWLLDHCTCGRRHHEVDAPTVGSGDRRGADYLFDRLGRRETKVPLLDDIELGDAIAAMEIFGRATLADHEPGMAKHHVVLNAGYEIFAQWPDGALNLFDGIVDRGAGSSGWGVVQAYGPFYEIFRRIEPSSLRDAVSELLARHGVENGIVRSTKTAFGIAIGERDTLSLQATAARLGFGFERARREVEKYGVDLGNLDSGLPALIPLEIVERIEKVLSEGGITATEVRRELTIGKRPFEELVQFGMLIPRSGERPLVFDRDTAEAFVRSLIMTSGEFRISSSINEISKRHCVPIARICEDVLARRLPCKAKDGGFSGLRICSDAAGSLYRSPKTPRMSVAQIAERIGVKWEVADSLARLGFFGPREDGGYRSIEIEAFERDYRKNVEMASRLRTSAKNLLEIAKKAGIDPAAGPPTTRQAFFSVAAAKKLEDLLRRR